MKSNKNYYIIFSLVFIVLILLGIFWYNNLYVIEVFYETELENIEENIEKGEVVNFYTYYKMGNGKYKVKGSKYTYKYKLEFLREAEDNSWSWGFIVLSNTEEITIEQVMKANPAIASDTKSYFNPEIALIVGNW